MDTLQAFLLGEAHRNDEMMVFDWDKAATIIKKEGYKEASAGLAGDWSWTGGEILKDGKPIPQEDTYTFLSSTWATPELEIDGYIQDCYKMASETDGWNSATYWPDSAIAILEK